MQTEEVSKLKSYKTIPVATPRALVVFCGDPRFQGPIHQFLQEELGLKDGEYLPFVIRGGVASLTLQGFLPKEAKYATEGAIAYLKQFTSIGKVILINHEDCGKYKILQKVAPFFFQASQHVTDRQRADLVLVATMLGGLSPRHVVFERYFAKFADSNKSEVVFEKQ